MVEIREITKRWGSVIAVDAVSLLIQPGEFLTLLGPSGCGKTTLLRMIGGFETPTSGAVLLDGSDVTREPPYRRNVNQVFQGYALFPHLDVFDNIAFGLRLKKLPRPLIHQRVDAAIELTSLDGLHERMPHQLSGGQRQRVALARAIVNEPKVLLLDEPLGALDARLRHSMQLELKRLQKRLGITFIFVTHDQEEAMTMSDRIAVMNGGRIVQLGSAEEVYHRPKTSFVAQFVGQTNLLPAHIVARELESAMVEIEGGIRFAIPANRLPGDASETVLSLRPERVRVVEQGSVIENRVAIEAVILETIFKGAVEQLLLRTKIGTTLTAQTSGAVAALHDLRALSVGQDVTCCFDPADVWPVAP